MINGMLNTHFINQKNLEMISNSHGGCNVHYVYYATGGWTNDILKCGMSKAGIITPEAMQLAQMWCNLIEEMGGVDGGGKIIHYAHSIGGADTLIAKSLLTPEEQAMIDVITIGSATLIPNHGFNSVINYVSWYMTGTSVVLIR